MPRIDPLKLLVCLSVLLAPNGGIRSANEVKRLANLMAKFSKKLVSKCIYIQILKCTETELLGQFMAAGGWSLVHMWLADGITTKNWPLIQELLELLLCCPVDVERLKSNTAPKLVKTLSKDSAHEGVRLLATKLVEQWLKIARNDIRSGNQQQSSQQSSPNQLSSSDEKSRYPEDSMSEDNKDVDESSREEEAADETSVVENGEDTPDAVAIDSAGAENMEDVDMDETAEGKKYAGEEEDVEETKKAFNAAVADSNSKKTPLLFKITMKNGKQVLAKVESPTKKSDTTMEENEDDKHIVEEVGVTDTVEEQDKTITDDMLLDETQETDSKEILDKSGSDKADMEDKKDKSEGEKDKDKERRKSVEKDRSKDSKDKSSSKDKDRHRDKKSSSSSSGHRSSSSKSSSSSSSKHNSSSSSNGSKSKSSSSSSSSKSSSSSSKDKEKDRSSSSSSSSSKHHHHKHSSSSSSSKTSSKSSSSSGNSNDKHREHKDKEKSSHSSKDKESHSKVSSPSSNSKMDRLPKKSKDASDETLESTTDNSKAPIANGKKASISIEVRSSEHRPKTVKTFNSQFRSHGLIEEAPPPPSRKGLKKPASSSTTTGVVGSTATGTVPNKRPSPPPSSKDGPPEKRAREDPVERPGAIKLIPPKRQPSLIESDMFMDALSATLKKDVKKRKRKLSGSEPGKVGDHKAVSAPSTPTTPTTPTPTNAALVADKTSSPEKTAHSTSPPTSPVKDEKVPDASTIAAAPSSSVPTGPESPNKVVAAPMSFYRDTLADSEENADDKKEQSEKNEPAETPATADGGVEAKPETAPDTPAEPDSNNDDDEDVVKKPKRLKSELIEDDEGDDKNLIDTVGDAVAKEMEAEGPEKKIPGPGCGPDGPPGVLVIHRRKGPKKQLKWKAQEELEEVRYFELDVTERCNVTRTFTDLKHMERVDERNKYMLARKVDTEDMMMERTPWLPLIVVDNVPSHPEGVNSQERRIQQNRERTILQALYFNRHMIPDSPAEPDVEVYSISEPVHIPMDDVTGNPDSVNDFTSMPWPEPKSTPPHESAGFNSPFFPGSGNEFQQFGNPNNWDLPGTNPGPLPGMFPPGRMGPGMPPMGLTNGPPPGAPPMMRQMNIPPNIQHNMPPNMGPPHPNMFQNNFPRGPHPMQHMNDRDGDNFRNGPPPIWFGGNNDRGNNRGPPPQQGNFNNHGGGGGRGGGNWNNDRGGPRGNNNYRPPWLSNNRGNQNNQRGGGRKW